MNFDDVIDNLKHYLLTEAEDKSVIIFDKNIAEALGITPKNFSMMRSRNNIPVCEIADYCAKNRISINWILYNQLPDSLNEQTEKLIEIKYLGDTYASAGAGAFNDSFEYDRVEYPNYVLSKLGYKKHLKNLEIISVSGDSMEPELSDGVKIFIDKNKTVPNENDIFVVNTVDGVFIKRLKFTEGNNVELVSSNDVYENVSFPIEDVGILGKAVISLG